MKFFLLFVCCVLGYPIDSCRPVCEIVQRHGYGCINITVVTEDEYELTVFRVLGKDNKPNDGPPLIFQHGITSSADSFFANDWNSAPFFFFNRSYDVWVPSARGSYYSLKHKKYKPDTEHYWNYTFEELGTKDTMAYIKEISRVTHKKVFYIGVSQGFMQIIAAFTLYPKFFQDHVEKIVGWAAVVRPDLAPNPGVNLIQFEFIAKLVHYFGYTYMRAFDYDSCLAFVKLCDWSNILCKLKKMISGDFLPFYDNVHGETYGSDAVSLKTLEHLIYNIVWKGFYRYSAEGVKIPYNLSNIRNVSIGIFVGRADLMASEANAEWVVNKINDKPRVRIVKVYDTLGHQTFMIPRYLDHFEDTYNFLKEKL